MKMNWVSADNVLLLNPRLSPEVMARYEYAWKNLVNTSFEYQVGIATSGSSGEQGRLIALSKSSLLISAQAVNERLQATSNDIWLKSLPAFHVGGLQIWARAHLSDATVIETRAEKWDASYAHREIAETRATLLSLVPTQLFDMVKLGLRAPANLRAVVIGGGRLDPDLQVKAVALGWPVLPSYGLTECCSQVATALTSQDSQLTPLSHVDIRIGEGERIEISSASLLSGQIVFDAKMNALFTDPKVEGWLRTEDRGEIDRDGRLTVTGRAQDFVKIGGEGVILSRLEQQLERLRVTTHFTHDAVVLAAEDERLGAVIVLLSDAETALVNPLVDQFNSAVMPYERIRAVYRVPSVPRSALGKLLRAQALALVGLKPVAHD
jgi:o-succinylbenzoate---CoA ligase